MKQNIHHSRNWRRSLDLYCVVKNALLVFSQMTILTFLYLKPEEIKHFREILNWLTVILPEYATEHWKEDDFFGYQFLNAINPNIIKKCSELPPNFPVTDEMVKSFLEKGSSLQKEMEVWKRNGLRWVTISALETICRVKQWADIWCPQRLILLLLLPKQKGNIFLYDQKKMDGIPGREIDDERVHVTPGLCLLYLNPNKKLMPIAIQVFHQYSEFLTVLTLETFK